MASNQPQPMMTQAQAAEMLRLQRRADRRGGCLFGIVMSLLFSWVYWTWLVVKWTVLSTLALLRWSWKASVVLWRWSWAAAVKCWQWSVAATRKATPYAVAWGKAFHARYGAKGWAALGAAVLVLAVLGSVFSSH